MKNKNIKAILFDSGKVLNYPATGNWFISPNFFYVVNQETFKQIEKKSIHEAFSKAQEYIQSINEILTKNEEYEFFKNFYKIFSSYLPELKLSQEDIDFITNDLVNNSEKYIFYDDVFKVIPVLYENYKLAIVSDAWPSLKDVYIHNDLLSYFDSFIISSQVKVTKPNQIIYQKALDELKILPNQALFIDDNLVNIKGAIKLGINGILLCRNKWIYRWNKIIAFGKKYQVIQNLEELINNEMIL